MTPAEFRAARIACGLSAPKWAKALGLNLSSDHNNRNAYNYVSDLECGRRTITPQMAVIAGLLAEKATRPKARLR